MPTGSCGFKKTLRLPKQVLQAGDQLGRSRSLSRPPLYGSNVRG